MSDAPVVAQGRRQWLLGLSGAAHLSGGAGSRGSCAALLAPIRPSDAMSGGRQDRQICQVASGVQERVDALVSALLSLESVADAARPSMLTCPPACSACSPAHPLMLICPPVAPDLQPCRPARRRQLS